MFGEAAQKGLKVFVRPQPSLDVASASLDFRGSPGVISEGPTGFYT